MPDSNSSSHMRQKYSEQALYRQLSHFRRQLDAQRALAKIPDPSKRDETASRLAAVQPALDAGVASVQKLQERSLHHWVNLMELCQV